MPSKAELQKQLSVLSQNEAERPLDLIPVLEQLAALCHRAGDYDEAQAYYDKMLTIRQAAWTCAANTIALIKVSHSLGLLHRIKQSFAEAEPHYKRALELSNTHYGIKHPETVLRRNYLAGLHFAWGKYTEAEQLLKTSLIFYEETQGKDHEVTAVCLYALALVTRRSENLVSENFFKRSVNLMKTDITRLSMDQPHDLFLALMHLSHDRFSEGRFDEAEELFRHSLLMELEEIWPEHPLVADSYQLLGDLYRSFSMGQQAEYFYRNALRIREQVFGPDHLKVGASAHALGSFLCDAERFQEAEPLLKTACQIYRKDAFPPVLANSLKAYALALKNLGRQSEAAEIAAEAESIFQKHGYART